MAGNLNLSLVLRADASGFKGEVRTARDELKDLGTEARQAGSAIGSQISSGVTRALAAFVKLRENIASNLRGAAANIAHQAQDIATQLGAGVNPITVLLQQGPQLLGSFGPQGVIVGAVLAGALAIGKQFLSAGDDIASAAERAEQSFKDAIDAINSSIGDGLPAVDKLVKDFEALPEALRGLGLIDVEADLRKSGDAVRDQSAALEVALAQLERAAEVRLTLGGSGRAAVGGPAGELTRAQAEEIERIAGQFRAGEIAAVEAIRQASAVAAEAGAAMRELAEGFRVAATESARLEVSLDRAQELMAKVADGAEANLGGRTIDQFEGLARAREDDIQSWRAWYHELVGGSIIPDMVTESESWFERLGRSMTTTTEDSAAIVGEAFRGLTRNVGQELAQLVTTSKIELNDLLSFVDSIATQILGRLIEGGLNAGINALFAPSASAALQPAFTTPGGTPVHTFHRGGVVGQGGVPRLVDPSMFIGAARYHGGGVAGLRPDEVPIIAQAGERILPRGANMAGAAVNVTVINEASGARAESRDIRRPDGTRDVTVLIKDEVSRQIARGDHDRAARSSWGLEPATARR